MPEEYLIVKRPDGKLDGKTEKVIPGKTKEIDPTKFFFFAMWRSKGKWKKISDRAYLFLNHFLVENWNA
jgi:hypothetical protein